MIIIGLDQTTLVEHEMPNWGSLANIRIRPDKTTPVKHEIANWGIRAKVLARYICDTLELFNPQS
jgi:hypothetical protein